LAYFNGPASDGLPAFGVDKKGVGIEILTSQ